LTGSLNESFPDSFTDSPELLKSYLTPPPSIISADEAFFESAFAQAISGNDGYLLTPATEIHEQSSFPFF